MEINIEDVQILKNYVNSYLHKDDIKIELIVKPECNQQCEYCYIYQHGKELYPIEQRKSNEEILNNIQLFLNYLLDKNLYILQWDLFAGDLFYDNFWFSIMDIFKKYYIDIQNKTQENKTAFIMIPCNFSFCHSDEKIKKVKQYVEDFKKLNVIILFSYSSDGKYSTDIREKRELSDDYYDKVFSLMAEYKWSAHPMISYEGINNAIKNYQWWVQMYNKYIIPANPHDFLPGFLEVRNDGWTNESIEKYLELLEYVIQHRLQLCHNNINELMKHLFYPKWYLEEQHILPKHEMDLISLHYYPFEDNTMHCAIGQIFAINCANLSFVPCHRTSYSFFTGGKFKIENNKIVDIEALEGIHGYFNQLTANTTFNLKCLNCRNRYFCMKGCRGAQFEYSLETFLPIPSVCNLLDLKYSFLMQRYHELGIFNELFSSTELYLPEDYKRELLKILKSRGLTEYGYKYQ